MTLGLSVGIKEAYKVAEEIDNQLSGYDFHHTALVSHGDGSFHIVRNALVFQWKDYYLVFAEHARAEAYHKEDATVFQFKGINIDVVGNNTLPYVRHLVIDNLPVQIHGFPVKPEVGGIFWIKDPEYKKGRTIQIISADSFMVKATEDFPRQSLWGPGEKEAWQAKKAAKKADPEWETYQRLIKKFEEDDENEVQIS